MNSTATILRGIIRHNGEIVVGTVIATPKSKWGEYEIVLDDGTTVKRNPGHVFDTTADLLTAEAEHAAIEAECRSWGYGVGRYTGD